MPLTSSTSRKTARAGANAQPPRKGNDAEAPKQPTRKKLSTQGQSYQDLEQDAPMKRRSVNANSSTMSPPMASAQKPSAQKASTLKPSTQRKSVAGESSGRSSAHSNSRARKTAASSATKSRRSSVRSEPPIEFGDMLATKSLLECVQLRDKDEMVQLSLSLDAFVERYTANNDEGILELVNFLLRASGLSPDPLELSQFEYVEEPLDLVIKEETLQGFINEAKKTNSFVEPYPLADKKVCKKFKTGLLGVVRGILEKLKHDILFDGMLLPWCIEWLVIMSNSKHRGVRHTGTEVALSIMMVTNEFHVEKLCAAAHQRMLLAGLKQKDMTRDTVAREVETLDERAKLLEEMHVSLFENVCARRCRDTVDDIRMACIQALGRCAVTHPEEYMKDRRLYRIGVMLNDQHSAAVRACAVQQLQNIYKLLSAEQLKMSSFSERWESRFLELTRDTSVTVSCEALRLLQILFDRLYITNFDDAMKQVLPLMHASEASIWRALAPLLQRYVSHTVDETKSKTKTKVNRLAASDSGLAGHAKSPLLRLAMLIVAQAKPEESAVYCERLVSAMRSIEPLLSNWAMYTELLLADADDEHAEAQQVLLQMMTASAEGLIKAVNSVAETDGAAKSKKKQRDQATHDQDLLDLSTQLGKSLPELLDKYGVHADQLRMILKLFQQMRLDAAQATLKLDRLKEILARLEAVCNKHTDQETLEACAAAWRSILEQQGAPALREAAQVRYIRLCGKLQQAVKPAASHVLKCKPGETPSLQDLNVTLLRLSCIASIDPQQIVGVRAVEHAMLKLAENTGSADELLTSCLLSVFRLQLVQLLYSCANAAPAEAADDTSASTVFELRDELLPLLCRSALVANAPELSLQSFLMLGVALTALKPFSPADSDEEGGELIQQAYHSYAEKLRRILVALSKGQPIGHKEEEDEEEEENELDEEDEEDEEDEDGERKPKKARAPARRYPQWLVEVARVAHLGAVPRAHVVGALLMYAEAVGGRLLVLLADLWHQLSKILDVGKLACDTLVHVLALCTGEARDGAVDESFVRGVGEQLATLLATGLGKKSADSTLLPFVIEGLRWTFSQPGNRPSNALLPEFGLRPSLKLLSREGVGKLRAELQSLRARKQLELPLFSAAFARAAHGKATPAGKSPAAQSSPDGSKRRRSTAASTSRKAARVPKEGSRRSSRGATIHASYNEDKVEESEEDEDEDVMEVDDGPREQLRREQSEDEGEDENEEESEDEAPWDGAGVGPADEVDDDEVNSDEEDDDVVVPPGTEEEAAPGSKTGARFRSIYDHDDSMDADEMVEDEYTAEEFQASQGSEFTMDELPVHSYARKPRKRAL